MRTPGTIFKMKPCGCGRCGLEFRARFGWTYHPACPHRAAICKAKQAKSVAAAQAARRAKRLARGDDDLTAEEIEAKYQQELAKVKGTFSIEHPWSSRGHVLTDLAPGSADWPTGADMAQASIPESTNTYNGRPVKGRTGSRRAA